LQINFKGRWKSFESAKFVTSAWTWHKMLIISKIHLIMTFIILSCTYVEISTYIKTLTVLSSEIIQNCDIYHTCMILASPIILYIQKLAVIELNNWTL
jgi:hypothetical protein